MDQDGKPERQYLDLLRRLLDEGSRRTDRTGVGTRALFGTSMRFDLSDGTVPLLTTKKVLWRRAVIEMLWFLSGSTSIRPLLEQGVHIWTDWPLAKYRKETGEDISREEFEARILGDDGFSRQWAGIGRSYGAQWRAWPKRDGGSIDQIAETIRLAKEDPYSRRNLFHAWNVEDLSEMSLPPCHLLYHVIVSEGRLNLILYQRSCDVFLGVSWNLLEAGLLLRMLAAQSGLEPGVFQWFGGDTHLYENHVEAAREQLRREPKGFPKLVINRVPDSIDGYVVDDFEIVGYEPEAFIKAPVAV